MLHRALVVRLKSDRTYFGLCLKKIHVRKKSHDIFSFAMFPNHCSSVTLPSYLNLNNQTVTFSTHFKFSSERKKSLLLKMSRSSSGAQEELCLYECWE